jgi:hypothetical protein
LGRLQGAGTAQRHYAPRQDAREDVVEYLDLCYHSTRFHSYLGSVRPKEYEALAQVASLRVRFSLTRTNRYRCRQCPERHRTLAYNKHEVGGQGPEALLRLEMAKTLGHHALLLVVIHKTSRGAQG